jgi:hypothetical protein
MMKDTFHDPKSISLRRSEMSIFVWGEAWVNKFVSRTQ